MESARKKYLIAYCFLGINGVITRDRNSKIADLLGRDTIHGRINARSEAMKNITLPLINKL